MPMEKGTRVSLIVVFYFSIVLKLETDLIKWIDILKKHRKKYFYNSTRVWSSRFCVLSAERTHEYVRYKELSLLFSYYICLRDNIIIYGHMVPYSCFERKNTLEATTDSLDRDA